MGTYTDRDSAMPEKGLAHYVGYGDNFGYDLSFSSFLDNTSGNFGLSFATLNTCVLEIQRFTVG